MAACEGNFLASSDDPVAVRMVSDKSLRRRSRGDDGLVDGERSPYVGVVSLVAVFAGAAATTVASLTAFVAAYVYVEAVRYVVDIRRVKVLRPCTQHQKRSFHRRFFLPIS